MRTGTDTLVLVSPGFPADEADTTCLTFLQTFVLALNRDYPSINVIIIAYQYPHNKGEYTWHGNKVISMHAKKGKMRKPFIWLRLWHILKAIKKPNKIIGILNFWCGEYVVVTKVFAKLHGFKNYFWLLGQDARAGNKFVKLIRPVSEEMIALSDAVAEEFDKNYKVRPLHILPFGLDTNLFSKNNFERTIDVLGVGSLIPLKQYNVFIEVVNELSKDFPRLTSLIYGKGHEEAALKEQVIQLGKQDTISVAGEMPYTEILQAMQQTKVFLHPSSYEGFGTVCLEALYVGAHVVSFMQPMKRDIAHWHIVKTKEEMINKVRALLADVNTLYSCVSIYTMDDTVSTVLKLYGVN